MQTFYIDRKIDAPRDVLWDVITDHHLYGEVASNLSSAEVIEGDEEGMKRRCYNQKGESWEETCVFWEEGREFSFEVDTSNYPYPLAKMQGTWGIKGSGDNQRVFLRFDYIPKYGFLGQLMFSLFFSDDEIRNICNGILDKWESKAKELSTNISESVSSS